MRDRFSVDSAIIVASHPRSGTHLVIDLLRRQFPNCEPSRSQFFLGDPYWNFDEIVSTSGGATERKIARMGDVGRPVLKTHRRPDYFANCQFTNSILPERTGFAREVMMRAARIYVYRSALAVMKSLYAMGCRTGEVPFSSFIREVRGPWSRVGWWAAHLSEWRRTEGTLLISYEELVRDPASAVGQIAKFIGETPLMRLPVLPRSPVSPYLERLRKLLPMRRESTALMTYGKQAPRIRLSPEDLEFMREEAMRIDPLLSELPAAEFEAAWR
jgi:hypothetical protein